MIDIFDDVNCEFCCELIAPIVKEEDYYVIDDSQVVQQIWERLARLEGFVGGNGLDVYWIVLE